MTLFENVRIFDGVGDRLSPPSSVLVRGNTIERISTDPIPVDRSARTRIIQGDGRTLMRGFTSVRDLSGPVFGLKRAIDEGISAGPRIWPSGAMISQTGGHGDFRMRHEMPAPDHRAQLHAT